jgi:virginiamycin B lyase
VTGRSRRRIAGTAAVFFVFALAFAGVMISVPWGLAQDSAPAGKVARPGVKEFQVPFTSLKSDATFKIGTDADWVQITDDAVWVASSEPPSVHKIDPKTNKEVAVVTVPGDPCSGLTFGFGSLWVPLCGKPSSMVRVDPATNQIRAALPIGPAGPEGGIAASRDSVWIVTDDAGTLVRIDPVSNKVRQTISIAPGSYNPAFDGSTSGDGTVWITGGATNIVTAVDASSGAVLATVPVGPKPRFLAVGGGSIWTLNQGDGSVTRVDAQRRKPTATIAVGIPGHGGDIAWGGGFVWTTVFGVPLTAIDGKTNRIFRQWVGAGGDSLRFGHDSVWLTDYKLGTFSRITYAEIMKSKISQ